MGVLNSIEGTRLVWVLPRFRKVTFRLFGICPRLRRRKAVHSYPSKCEWAWAALVVYLRMCACVLGRLQCKKFVRPIPSPRLKGLDKFWMMNYKCRTLQYTYWWTEGGCTQTDVNPASELFYSLTDFSQTCLVTGKCWVEFYITGFVILVLIWNTYLLASVPSHA